MTAKNVYDLHRGLLGFYPLTTMFGDTAIKLFDIRLASKPSGITNSEDDVPGDINCLSFIPVVIHCGTKLIPTIETLFKPSVYS